MTPRRSDQQSTHRRRSSCEPHLRSFARPVVALPDAALLPPDASSHPAPEQKQDLGRVCLWDDWDERWVCYSLCHDGDDCRSSEMCKTARDVSACVPDCRSSGCKAGLECFAETGLCRVLPRTLQLGHPCESADDCGNCCVWERWRPEPGEPSQWRCVPREERPEGQGVCGGRGSCGACMGPGSGWCSRDGLDCGFGDCEPYAGPSEEVCDGDDCWTEPASQPRWGPRLLLGHGRGVLSLRGVGVGALGHARPNPGEASVLTDASPASVEPPGRPP